MRCFYDDSHGPFDPTSNGPTLFIGLAILSQNICKKVNIGERLIEEVETFLAFNLGNQFVHITQA